MANTKQSKLDATRPLYAVVGVGDLAVEYARTAATDVQARFSKVELEPKVLRDQARTVGDQARTVVVTRVEGLTEDAKEAQAKFEALVAEFQSDAKALPAKVENFVNETVAEFTGSYDELAARGKDLVTRVRKQQSTVDVKAAAKTVVAKAKTTRTQTTKSAKNATETIEAAANDTATTVQSNVKATGTSASKTVSAAADATTDAATKVGD